MISEVLCGSAVLATTQRRVARNDNDAAEHVTCVIRIEGKTKRCACEGTKQARVKYCNDKSEHSESRDIHSDSCLLILPQSARLLNALEAVYIHAGKHGRCKQN